MLLGDKNMNSEWQRESNHSPTTSTLPGEEEGLSTVQQASENSVSFPIKCQKNIVSFFISSLDLKKQYILGVYISHSILDKKHFRISLPLHKSSMESVQHLHGKWTKKKHQFCQDSSPDGMRKIS